jgi:uncharacterized repeat protein (TIGR03803 family)
LTKLSICLRLTLLATAFALACSPAVAQTWEKQDLYSFGQRDPQGGNYAADPPILGADGSLYGTTLSGGTFNKGVVYRFRASDGSYLVLRHFLGGADGGSPLGTAFIQADDGRLYGLAVNPRLILYSLATDGSDYHVLFTFPPGAEQGGVPENVSSLTAGQDGLVYGIYVTGGPNSPPSQGTLFRIGRDGNGFQILTTVVSPSSPLSYGATGDLFGLTLSTLYRLSPDGGNFHTIANFPPGQVGPADAEGGLVHASDGFIYGVSDHGGSADFGTVFRVQEDGNAFQVIYDISSVMDGGHYRAPAFEGSDGLIYGGLGENLFGVDSVIWRIHKDGTGWQVLRRFSQNGRGTNGVVEALDGFLYGCNPIAGQLFQLARDGSTFAVMHTFATSEGFPLTPIAVVRGTDQYFYGLTDQDGTGGHGTLFRINADGSGFIIEHDFGAGVTSEMGTAPKWICAGPDGALYGIVRQQGSAGAGVFRFAPAGGTFVWLHTFGSPSVADEGTVLISGSDGRIYGAFDTNSTRIEQVFGIDTGGTNFAVLRTLTTTTNSGIGTSALTEGPDGFLYGATTRNGSSTLPLLFRLSRDGLIFAPLHDVTAGANPGLYPPFGLLAATNGIIYGYASNVLFRCNPDGSGFQTVHTFSGTTFSQQPLEGVDGKIYGALPFGGSVSRGSVFRLVPDGSSYEELVSFSNEPVSGQVPLGTLITASDGAFYGLNRVGGDANRGTLFRIASPAQLTSAVSRKTHGAAGNFDIALPLTGAAGIESRTTNGTNDYTVVITFAGNVAVTGTPQAAVTVGTGCVGTNGTCIGNVSVSGNVVTVPLTNIANAQTINVRLNGVNNAGSDAPATDFTVPMSVLIGDTNANGTVNAADVAQTKGRVGQAVGATNFRSDVNANGSINAADTAIIKQNSGTSLPP